MKERGLAICAACRNTGRDVTGYDNRGNPILNGPCSACGGSGFVPTLGGAGITWKTAYAMMEKETATRVAVDEQGKLL